MTDKEFIMWLKGYLDGIIIPDEPSQMLVSRMFKNIYDKIKEMEPEKPKKQLLTEERPTSDTSKIMKKY